MYQRGTVEQFEREDRIAAARKRCLRFPTRRRRTAKRKKPGVLLMFPARWRRMSLPTHV